MARRRVYFDTTEVVVLVPGNKGLQNINLIRNDIHRIYIEKCNEPIWGIIPRTSERIRISTAKSEEPILLPKLENKKFYDEYKEGFIKFAKANFISIENTVNE